ncbi:hypothetical protein TRIUR3_08873 [Triticum urartu]|uniref:Uncharacterized protein n=1 Tax=Triticum urartu TaxID=4572 RepID=M7ZTZ4_TRIUA|nr:hypothetical protein TRIUR3_08873 [Triticum urartu]
MNFLYRAAQPELPRIPEQQGVLKTLEGLIADDPLRISAVAEDDEAASNGAGEIGGDTAATSPSASSDSKSTAPAGKHSDVSQDEGWITIPNSWCPFPLAWPFSSSRRRFTTATFLLGNAGPRSFLGIGVRFRTCCSCGLWIAPSFFLVHILACLSASKQDMTCISPFRIAAVMSKSGNSPRHPTNKSSSVSENGDANGTAGENSSHGVEDNMESVELNDKVSSPSKQDILETESLLRMEDRKQQIETVLQKFKRSNFFVRIAESDEPLWSKKRVAATKTADEQLYSDSQGNNTVSRSTAYNTISDKGVFDGSTSGGVARDTVRCYALQNGDIVLPNIRSPPISENQEFVPEKPAKTPDVINDGQLSFRGVPLEPERYSVRCGLEGVYLPGKRWSRKVEIIQPIEVHSFSAKCTAENLLCVLIKNIAPRHVQDIVVFIDAITVVFEEASKGGSPLSLPIASIEVGHGHSLPNLSLRRGEEHSFILKPAIMSSRDRRINSDVPLTLSLPKMSGAATNTSTPRVSELSAGLTDQYAVLISYRCNYTESKLFFKQATSWQPCAASDLMISVSSELSLRNPSPSARVPQLPVQVLTLEATNMTSENLTLTVLAPEASGSSSVVSLNSAPTTPDGSYDNLNEPMRRCVPARSSTTVKLELLPLTDGIITLDTLQITIKEKGLTYIPEHSLEIHASSAISAGSSYSRIQEPRQLDTAVSAEGDDLHINWIS